MLVRQLMTTDVATVHPGSHLFDALTLLDRAHVDSAPVVDDRGILLGVVSTAELVQGLMPHEPDADARPFQPRIVDDVYAHTAAAVQGDDHVEVAVDTLLALGASTLPVVDERERLLGIVSRTEALQAIADVDLLIAAEIDDVLELLGHTDWAVGVERGVVKIAGPASPQERSVAYDAARAVPRVIEVFVG